MYVCTEIKTFTGVSSDCEGGNKKTVSVNVHFGRPIFLRPVKKNSHFTK